MFNAALNADFKALSIIDKKKISNTNEHGQTILHTIASNHRSDLLFACIYLGCDQSIIDHTGKRFTDYLEPWEHEHLRQLYNAWRAGKLQINVYRDNPEYYSPHEFTLLGYPLLRIIWEHNLGTDMLKKILGSGIDLDVRHLCNVGCPQEYKAILATHGWVQSGRESVQTEIDTFYPPQVWTLKQREQQFTTVPVGEVPPGIVDKTIVCISDTHWAHRKLHVPGGDVLICSGDICMPWIKDLRDFIIWLGNQSHPYKILVAGNHDKLIQRNKDHYLEMCKKNGIIYLEDSGVELYGIKFWGSPWTPLRHRNKNNAFTLTRSELMTKWNMIPSDTQILITHCPPYGVGDLNTDYYKVAMYQSGDFGLRKTINRLLALKLHVFGHQHYGRGLYKGSNGVYFANCALVNNSVAYTFS